MHLLKVSFISWRWQKRLLAPLPSPHPPAFHGCQITSRVPCPAVIQNWIVLQGFGEWRLLYPDWVWNHGQACLILLCLHFNSSKCTRACWLNVSLRGWEGNSMERAQIRHVYADLFSLGKKIQSGGSRRWQFFISCLFFKSLHWDTVGKEIIKDVCGWMEFKWVWHCVVSMESFYLGWNICIYFKAWTVVFMTMGLIWI